MGRRYHIENGYLKKLVPPGQSGAVESAVLGIDKHSGGRVVAIVTVEGKPSDASVGP